LLTDSIAQPGRGNEHACDRNTTRDDSTLPWLQRGRGKPEERRKGVMVGKPRKACIIPIDIISTLCPMTYRWFPYTTPMQKLSDNVPQEQTEQIAKQNRKRVHASAFCRIDIIEDQPGEDQTHPEKEERNAKSRKIETSDEEDQSDVEEEDGSAESEMTDDVTGSGGGTNGSPDLWYCSNCSNHNPAWHSSCPYCGASEW
jgi:hypothetical protein